MLKILSIAMMVGGISIVAIGGFHLSNTMEKQKTELSNAYNLLEENDFSEISMDNKAFTPKVGETVGILSVPRLKVDLPIVEGTSDEELIKGVGHYRGTAFPTQHDQIVLSGHRDTVFRRMGELVIGDLLIMKFPYGNFTYKIENIKIVDANDRSIITSTAPEEVLIVSTCYPFSYIGNAPERYILIAKPDGEE